MLSWQETLIRLFCDAVLGGPSRGGRDISGDYAEHFEGVASEIARMLDTSTYSVAIDVGGADGALVHSLMQDNPHLRGVVLDRPEVAAAAAAAAKARRLAERTEAIGGDFFKPVPEGDLYLLRFILHDWDDADAIRILESCRQAMKPDARLVVIEAFFAELGEQIPANMSKLRIAALSPDLALRHRLVGFAKTTEAKAVQG